jgi:hypothetical protein
MAVRTQEVGAHYLHCAQDREDGFRTQPPVEGGVAAAAGAGSLLGFGRIMLQQFIQQRRSRLVEGGADCHLHRLQVQMRGVVTLAKDESQQLFYFTGDFLLDGLRRFFSCGVRDSSTGRARQIFSLTSNKRCANWRKR